MTLVLISEFIFVNRANLQSAQSQIEDDLEVAERVFTRLIESRSRQLAEGAHILSSDFAFKTAFAEGDHMTTLSALENLGQRIGADTMMLVSLDYALIADTTRPDARDEEFFLPWLIEKAEEDGDAFSIVFIGDQTHQMVVVPLLAPSPIAWLCVSFLIDQKLVNELRRLTLSHISLFREEGNNAVLITSTLSGGLNKELLGKVGQLKRESDKSFLLDLAGENYVTLVTTIFKGETSKVTAVLQRSLEKALQPFYRLRTALAIIAAVGLGVMIIGGVLTSRTVTKPVNTLVEGVREISKSNYNHIVTVDQQDELGELAGAFNKMTIGLAERDKVRNLLGKVMSPAVAHELLNKEVTLGGEERVMTAFFSDIAGFTSISEKMKPTELVSFLNEYLSAMAEIIYETDGVIDKFIGDAVVSFWGAPLPAENHAELAVKAAVGMQKKLAAMRANWRKAGKEELFMRIGINTGSMVVGNMGSADRMDYTMMGDSVNLAARLEGANKYYGTDIMISESTYLLVREKYLCRELDRICVQGKTESIKVYEVLDESLKVGDEMKKFAARFEEALTVFRRGDFKKAMEFFENCNAMRNGSDAACSLYLKRASDCLADPPGKEWEPVYNLPK